METTLYADNIQNCIYLIRGKKVMMDKDLARLYGVETKALLQAVKRNPERFPADFMFQLEWAEAKTSRSQIVTLKKGSNLKYRPYAFTEQGIAMLSSVLRSKQAILVNIAIMRVFVKLRDLLASNRELSVKLGELEKKLSKHDHEIQNIFHVIRKLMTPPENPKRRIGFHIR